MATETMRWVVKARAMGLCCALVLLAGACGAEDSDGSGQPAGQAGVGGTLGGQGGVSGQAGAAGMVAGEGGMAGAAGMIGEAGTAGMAGMAGMLAGEGGMAGAAGVGGEAGTAGMAAGEGGMGGDPQPREDLGMGDGSDVIAIGDSWMNLGSVGIQQSLIRTSGQPYRGLGVPGVRFLDGVIPGQYAAAKAANPNIKTVIMTGGGNDILQNPLALLDCPAVGATCRSIIDMVGEGYLDLTYEMADDGVEDLIIINYSRNTLLGAGPVDYTTENLSPQCATSPVRCHLVDADEVAGGLMMLRDGIHPTDANYDLLAEHIYDMMIERGMRR